MGEKLIIRLESTSLDGTTLGLEAKWEGCIDEHDEFFWEWLQKSFDAIGLSFVAYELEEK